MRDTVIEKPAAGFWCRMQISPSHKQAFLSALIIGLAAHIYKFTNTLYNHDAIYNVYSSNDVLTSGRWFLAAASLPSSCFDLPWINGLLSLIWIALAACVVIDIFCIRSTAGAVLTGGLLAVFPSVTATFFYEFTADGYMLAMLLASLSVYFNRVGDRVKWHITAAALLICLCCGIYQAYVSFALLLSMSHFILELLGDRQDDRQFYRWIGRQFIVYGAGLLAYYVVWKLRMYSVGVTASGYQGISELGSVSAAGFSTALFKTAKTLASFLLGGNVFKYGITFYAVMNMAFLAFLTAAVVLAAVKARLWKKAGRLLLLLLSAASLPVFACIWNFISPSVNYYPVMLQSLCVPYILTLALIERRCGFKFKTAAVILLTVIVCKFALQANMAYFELERCNRTTASTAAEMLTRIHLLDDGSVERIAFIGGREDSLVTAGAAGIEEITVFANMLRPTLLYDHAHAAAYFVNVAGCGYAPLSLEEAEALEASGIADDMPQWPLSGSVKIIGDTAVIRLPDA